MCGGKIVPSPGGFADECSQWMRTVTTFHTRTHVRAYATHKLKLILSSRVQSNNVYAKYCMIIIRT